MRDVKKEVIVGVTVVVSIGLLVWGVNFLKGVNIFSKTRVFYAKYNRIEGLSESSPVIINGSKVGRVKEIAFDPSYDGSLIVAFSVEVENFRLPKTTRARISSLDLLGSKSVTLELPLNIDNYWEEQGYLEDGDTLMSDVERSITDEVNAQIAPLKKKAESLLASIDTAVTIIKVILNKDAREDLRSSFESIKNTFLTFETLASRLDSMSITESEKVSSMLSNIESITYNIRNNNENITSILDNFREISDSLVASNLTIAINNASEALTQASEMMQRIYEGEGTLGMLIQDDSLYNNLNAAAANLDKLLIDLESNPKRYVHFSVFGRNDKRPDDKKDKDKGKDKKDK